MQKILILLKSLNIIRHCTKYNKTKPFYMRCLSLYASKYEKKFFEYQNVHVMVTILFRF